MKYLVRINKTLKLDNYTHMEFGSDNECALSAALKSQCALLLTNGKLKLVSYTVFMSSTH